jgi:hypothetical protein
MQIGIKLQNDFTTLLCFALLSIPPKEHLSTNSSATLARKKL